MMIRNFLGKIFIVMRRFCTRCRIFKHNAWKVGAKMVVFPLLTLNITFCVLVLTFINLLINILILDGDAKLSVTNFIRQMNYLFVGVIFGSFIVGFIIYCAYKFYKLCNGYYLQDNALTKNQIISKYTLSVKARENEYEIRDFINYSGYCEKYIMSNSVNVFLLENRIGFSRLPKYTLSNTLLAIFPHVINKKLEDKNKSVTNGKVLGLVDDIVVNSKTIRVRKVSYFDSLLTHGLVYKVIYEAGNLQPYFNGETLLFETESKIIRDISTCLCTNFMGASTLLITQENAGYFFWIVVQGQGNDANAGRIAPSGSGSVDYKDITKKQSFNDILTYAMERELCEETGTMKKVCSKVIGYARLLERGGKPDFFGLSYFSGSLDDVKIRICEKTFVESLMKVPFNSYLTLPEELKLYCDERNSSIQLVIIFNILKHLRDKFPQKYEKLFVDLGVTWC